MKIRIKDLSGFTACVFGAECFLENFPEIHTTGIWVKPTYSGSDYVWSVYDPETGIPYHSSTFFTIEEMQYLECVDNPDHVFEISEEEKDQMQRTYNIKVAVYLEFMERMGHLFKDVDPKSSHAE